MTIRCEVVVIEDPQLSNNLPFKCMINAHQLFNLRIFLEYKLSSSGVRFV